MRSDFCLIARSAPPELDPKAISDGRLVNAAPVREPTWWERLFKI
ncbi:MAG: hypothetical protein NQU42_05420 [Methanothrix sp.]|nr:hypothetical protein [Methanothrix sp.]MCQ8903513.1 hypothetical protein [Methanothrix sp.]